MPKTIVEFKTGSPTKKDPYQIIAQYKLLQENNTDIDFFEDGHIYKKDGKRIWSITQILDIIQSWKYSDNNTVPMDRGKFLHKVFETYNKGTLDVFGLDDEAQHYLKNYIDFLEEYNLIDNKVESEKIMYSKRFNYSGTLDAVFYDTPENKLILLYLTETSYKSKVVKFTNEKFREFQCFQITHRIKNL